MSVFAVLGVVLIIVALLLAMPAPQRPADPRTGPSQAEIDRAEREVTESLAKCDVNRMPLALQAEYKATFMRMFVVQNDPYAVLGVPRDATRAEVAQSYRRLSLKWHPDKIKCDHSRELISLIRDAYERITAWTDR